MTILNKLDDVLECLFKISGDNPDFAKIENWLKENNRQIERGEIQDCLLYLYNENISIVRLTERGMHNIQIGVKLIIL